MIPSTFNGKFITVLKKSGFQGNKFIKSISILTPVIEIGRCCLYDCKSLKEIVFEEGSCLKKVGDDAFAFTGLQSIKLPKSVEDLGIGCFLNCSSFKSLTFEEGTCIKSVGGMKVSWTDPRHLVIPKEIPSWCLFGFITLERVTFEEGSCLRRCCMTIGQDAFNESSIASVFVPKGKTELFKGMLFSGTGLDSNKVQVQETQEQASEEDSHSDERNAASISPSGVDKPKPVSDLLIELSEYERVQSLGSGGFGQVFLYRKGDSLIPMKFINSDYELTQISFERESKNLRSLSHPFIVKLRGLSLPSPGKVTTTRRSMSIPSAS